MPVAKCLPMPTSPTDVTGRTLVDLIEAAARRQPSVMLFEDAHWADRTTLEVLDLLIDRVRKVPLLVVLTHRPEFQSRWSEQGHVGALNLSKLTRAQSAAMVSTLAGRGAARANPDKDRRCPAVRRGVDQVHSRNGRVEGRRRSLRLRRLSSPPVTIPATHRDSLRNDIPATLHASLAARRGARRGPDSNETDSLALPGPPSRWPPATRRHPFPARSLKFRGARWQAAEGDRIFGWSPRALFRGIYWQELLTAILAKSGGIRQRYPFCSRRSALTRRVHFRYFECIRSGRLNASSYAACSQAGYQGNYDCITK